MALSNMCNFQHCITGGWLESLELSLMGVVRGQYMYTSYLLEQESHHHATPPSWCSNGPSPLRLVYLHTRMHSLPHTFF